MADAASAKPNDSAAVDCRRLTDMLQQQRSLISREIGQSKREIAALRETPQDRALRRSSRLLVTYLALQEVGCMFTAARIAVSAEVGSYHPDHLYNVQHWNEDRAMHISDSVLPPSVTIAGFAVSAAISAWSVRRTNPQDLPKIAVVTSAFFVASLVHVPMGPTSGHSASTMPCSRGGMTGRFTTPWNSMPNERIG